MNRDEIQQEALNHVAGRKRAGIVVSMGIGKTRIGLLHMMQHPDAKVFLVVYPKISVKKSWIDEINKAGLQCLLPKIIFTTYNSLNKMKFDIFDFVYLDECHSLTPNHNEWLIKYCTKGSGNILGLTGTYPKAGDKLKMCSFYTPKAYEYTVDQAVSDGILNDYRITVHMLPLDERKNREKKKKNGEKFYSSEKKDYDYWSEKCENFFQSYADKQRNAIMRMKVLQSFESKSVFAKHLYEEQTDKTLLFANTMKQANSIDRNSVHSGNPYSERVLKRFKDGEIDRITSVQQLSEGVTIPNLKTIIILHSFSNPKQAIQKLGRAMRLNPNETAHIHILCYKNTVDEKWVNDALADLDQSKIEVKQAKFYTE